MIATYEWLRFVALLLVAVLTVGCMATQPPNKDSGAVRAGEGVREVLDVHLSCVA